MASGRDAALTSELDTAAPATVSARRGPLADFARQYDWSRSVIGAPEGWPQNLRTTVELMLATDAQIVLFWGAEYVAIYNAAYAPSIGRKHPGALGRPACENWGELWDDLEPLLRRVRETGETFSAKDRPFHIERHGYPETVYFDVSYSAAPGEDGEVGGVLCIVAETTERVRAGRELQASEARLRFLGSLDEALRSAQDAPGAMAAAAELLALHLGASRTAYADVDADADRFFIRSDYAAPGIASSAGIYSLDLFGPRAAADMRSGRTLVVRDVAGELAEGEGREMFAAIDIAAIVCCPLLKNGRLVAMMAVHQAAPRTWKPDEIALVEAVVERCWGHVQRVGAEARLRESEERLRLATENAGIGFWDVDLVGDVLIWSPEVRAMFGVPADAPVTLADFFAGLHPADREPTNAAYQAALDPAVRAPYDVEYRTVGRSDGVIRWVAAKGRGIFDETGRCIRLIGAAIDITDRKRAEARLLESEARFRLMADAVPQIVWITDAEGRTEFFNKQWSNYTGAAYEPTTAADIAASFVHPDDVAATIDAFNEARRTGGPFRVEHRIRSAAGDYRWFLVRGEPARDPGTGEIVRWFGASVDIHDRRRAEARLRDLNDTLEQQVAARSAERDRLWNLSQDMLARADFSGMMGAVSPAWTRVLGWSERELLSRGYATFMHPEDMPPTLAALAAMGESGQPTRFQNRIATRDGGYKWIEWTVAPEADGINFIAVGRDLSEAKAREAELEAAQEALRQSQKMEAMGQLTGGVAHDFNNLLMPILATLDKLDRLGLGEARERRLIGGALQSAERAKTLVQRLLAFARRQPLQSTPVDIGKLVAGMADLVASTTGPQIKVLVDAPDNLPAAMADPNQVEMALLNLAVNARDAMPDGGTLRISASAEVMTAELPRALRPGAYIRLAVTDTGVGMDEATLSRAVEPFFSTKGIGRGTGLGLSMVHGLASQLGGALVILSQPGAGTTVELWLPQSAAAAEEDAVVETAPAAEARGVVLLVDDEEVVRLSTADMLSDLGYEVLEAGSAEEALTLVERDQPFDLVVTDHLMPGMNGVELAKALQRARPEVPVLLVSGYAETEGVTADLPRLTKPFRKDELARALAQLA